MNKYFKWTLFGALTTVSIILFFPFVSEILVAGVFAFAMEPITRKLALTSRFQKNSAYFRRKRWVAITLAGLIVLISVPVGFAIYSIFSIFNKISQIGFQNTDFFKDLVQMRAGIITFVNHALGTFNLESAINLSTLSDRFLNTLGQGLMTLSAQFISLLPNMIMFVFVFCCALYYFLVENRQIKKVILDSNLISEFELGRLVGIFQSASRTTIFASFVTGALQAAVVAIGSLIFQTGEFFLIFIVTFFFSFIPVIGAAPVAIFLSLLVFIKGQIPSAVGFLVIALVAGTIDNIVRPYLAAGDDEVHPVLILLGLIGAIYVFGLPGLFLGPVITSVTSKFYSSYFIEQKNIPQGIIPKQ